jgi:hypothetical protein
MESWLSQRDSIFFMQEGTIVRYLSKKAHLALVMGTTVRYFVHSTGKMNRNWQHPAVAFVELADIPSMCDTVVRIAAYVKNDIHPINGNGSLVKFAIMNYRLRFARKGHAGSMLFECSLNGRTCSQHLESSKEIRISILGTADIFGWEVNH